MKNLNVCLQELGYASSDLCKVLGHIELAIEAVEGKKSTIGTRKDTLDGALYRAIMLQEELNNLLKKFEATATEK